MGAAGSELPPIGEPAPPQPSRDANAELAGFATGKLKRSDTRDKHLHYCALVFLWAALAAFLISGAVWLYHLLTPVSRHFLSDAQVQTLQSLLITAFGSAAFTKIGDKYFGKDS